MYIYLLLLYNSSIIDIEHSPNYDPEPSDDEAPTFELWEMWSTPSFVIYWPSTMPSIKRCTFVNKRRNSGSRWTSDNYITRCHRRLESVLVWVGVSSRQDTELRASGRKRALGPQWPTVEQPNQDVKEVPLWSEELWVNM